MACAGARGRFIEHTCGKDGRNMELSSLTLAVLGMAKAEEKPDFADLTNWTNGKIHPNRIPILLLVGLYQRLGYDLDNALAVLEESWLIHNKESAGKDWGFFGDPNRQFESPTLLPEVKEHISRYYAESHIERLNNFEQKLTPA
jgi:hypothetical protein